MGGGAGGNFGNTYGSELDDISNLLAAASLIPGADTFVDLVSIPIDLLRGDFVSAGLDALGVIPVFGEIADAAKTAKAADDIIDAVKLADKAGDVGKAAKKSISFSSFPKKIHIGRQGKHIIGHNNYQKGKSVFYGTVEDAQKLINKHSGTGRKIGVNKESVDFKRIIGQYIDPKTGKAYDTTVGTIHYSKSGTHIVPGKPNKFGG